MRYACGLRAGVAISLYDHRLAVDFREQRREFLAREIDELMGLAFRRAAV